VGIARRVIESSELIVAVWDGAITPEEWSEVVQRQVADPSGSFRYRRLTDARTADVSAISRAHVDDVSESFGAVPANIAGVKLAIVASAEWATAQQVEESMSRFGVTTVVFNDVHAACAWIGVDADLTLGTITELRNELRGLQ
jgi:hypothetical protein